MLSNLDPASALAVALLIFALVMVILFEATNGFHDAANAVATVIYSKSLTPIQAVVLSGVMNFLGVLLGGISVAYALVELLPTDVLSPPGGGPAVAMLVALFIAALSWNIGTWWLALPNSSSHCLIGSLIGIALGNAAVHARELSAGVHWAQLSSVLKSLALSPVLGFVLAAALYLIARRCIHDENLYEPPGANPPVWWMRFLLSLTCSGVSFAHGTNDGQKSIGLIMLTIIGLFPATFALDPQATAQLGRLPGLMREARPLITQFGDAERSQALDAMAAIEQPSPSGSLQQVLTLESDPNNSAPIAGRQSSSALARSSLRDSLYRVIAQLKYVEESHHVSPQQKAQAKGLLQQIGSSVQYAPKWVRMLSAICLGVGTLIGYKRIVVTLGERLGNIHLTPAQGACAELVSAVLITAAGFTGLPVSTTHVVTSGIGGTMVTAGAGLRYSMLKRIMIAWVLTLPITIIISGTLYYFLASPRV
ncbi:MAG TPA: anion permease [Steroidobacteraceae bacterium]|jgi:PiT family inorganic phosphate transporter